MICEGFPKLGVPRGVPKIGITVFGDLYSILGSHDLGKLPYELQS